MLSHCPSPERLREDGPILDPPRTAGSTNQVGQAQALDRGGGREPQKTEDGRQEVDVSHGHWNALSRGDASAREHERDMYHLLVHVSAMRQEAVLQERLAVVSGQHEDGILSEPQRLQSIEEGSELVVDVADLTIVVGQVLEVIRGTLIDHGVVGFSEEIQVAFRRCVGCMESPAGVGVKLHRSSLRWFDRQKVHEIEATILIGNKVAQKIALRLGYEPIKVLMRKTL